MNKNNTSDQNKLSSRIKRYGQVSSTVANLAVTLAGEKYLGLNVEKDAHADKVMLALGNLKGPMMKIGQILATIPEALPPEYAKAFQELQSNAPPMGWPFVRRRMKTELGQEWGSKFKSFEKEAAAAASLGQVHKALAKNSQLLNPLQLQKEKPQQIDVAKPQSTNAETTTCEPKAQREQIDGVFIEEGDVVLACKLQYPDMASAIEADLAQLKLMFSMYEKYDKSIKTEHIHAELAERLHEELDYKREAKQCKLYTHMLRDEKNVHIPEIIDELSTGRLLTSTWLDGKKILDFVDAPTEQRNTIALNLFRAWYVPLYYYGVIHGDPHLGNYTVREDNSINLLDFGCVRVFPPRFVGGVIDLYNGLMDNDMDRLAYAFETWGFKDLSIEELETLKIWAEFLYGPVMEDKVRPLGVLSEGIYGKETAAKVHTRLRELSRDKGGIAIPREFVFMDRAALGLGSVFLHLKAEVNWHNLFNELIADFDLKTLEDRQQKTLNMHGL